MCAHVSGQVLWAYKWTSVHLPAEQTRSPSLHSNTKQNTLHCTNTRKASQNLYGLLPTLWFTGSPLKQTKEENKLTNKHTHTTESGNQGEEMLTFKLSKGFCPKRCSWLTWGNRAFEGTNAIYMLSACTAVHCTEDFTFAHISIQHTVNASGRDTVHFRLDYVSVWWIVTPSAGKASLCSETKSIRRSWRININMKNQLEVRSCSFI